MRLSDLRVHNPVSGHQPVSGRQASVADLVAALIAEGGEIRTLYADETGDGLARPLFEPGRYLVFPIPADEETTT